MRSIALVFAITLAFSGVAQAQDAKLREEIGILKAEKQALEERVRKLTDQLAKAQAVEAELVKLRQEIARGFGDMSDRIARLEGSPVRVATRPDVPRDDSKSIARVDNPNLTTPTITTPSVTTPRVNPPTTTTPTITNPSTPATTNPSTTTPPKTTTPVPTFIPPSTTPTTIARADLPRIPDPVTPSNPLRPRPRGDRPSGTPTTLAMVDMVKLWGALKEKKAIEDGLSDLVYAVQFADQSWAKRIRETELDISLLAEGSEAWLEKKRQFESFVIERNVAIGSAQTRLNRRRGELTKALYTKMVEAIGRVADDNGYDAVIFKEPEPQYSKVSSISNLFTDRMVIVGTESVDLTEQAIRLMNREFERVGG